MSAPFAQGPWTFDSSYLEVEDISGLPVAEVAASDAMNGDYAEDVVSANGHLIAAAPQLFEAAQDAGKALELLRRGLSADAKAVELIDAHLDEIETALLNARGDPA